MEKRNKLNIWIIYSNNIQIQLINRIRAETCTMNNDTSTVFWREWKMVLDLFCGTKVQGSLEEATKDDVLVSVLMYTMDTIYFVYTVYEDLWNKVVFVVISENEWLWWESSVFRLMMRDFAGKKTRWMGYVCCHCKDLGYENLWRPETRQGEERLQSA